MMSLEREASNQLPAINSEAANWAQGIVTIDSPYAHNEQMDILCTEQPDLFEFVHAMNSLRNALFPADDPHMYSYQSGGLFMYFAAAYEYSKQTSSEPIIDGAVVNNYFQQLIDPEVNHAEVEEIKAEMNIPEDRPLTPQKLLTAELRYGDGFLSTALERVRESFIKNSRQNMEFFANTEITVTDTLAQTDLGPQKGLMFGALDVFMCFKTLEEIDSFHQRMEADIPISISGPQIS